MTRWVSIGLLAAALAAPGGCTRSPAGPADPRRSAEPVAPAPPPNAVPMTIPAPSATASTPSSSGVQAATLPPLPVGPLPRIAEELGAPSWATLFAPFDVEARSLSATGFVDPMTEDLGDARVAGFPVATKWGAPKTADFAQKLGVLLQSDASYQFDVVTRCKPSKAVLGFVLRPTTTCAPTGSCAEVVQIAVNLPCHQIFVNRREVTNGKAHGKAWGAHFGPSKDKLIDLLAEGFPEKATFLRSLR